MKHELNVDDGDLEYLNARYQEGLTTINRLRQTLEKFLNLAFEVTVKLCGVKVIRVEGKLYEHSQK